jgi:alpha-tubulin suppressor-like RCC1 family protein
MALTYYSRILKVDATETEAHWGYLLSKYGVEVSQEAATLNQIFFHRLEHSSFIEDPSYEKMITYCPAEARYYYEGLSRKIETQHSKMLEISRQTGIFDIYVNCVEEPGTAGYMLANQVGKALDEAGYRVFLPATMLNGLSPEEKNLREMAVAEKATAMIVVVTPGTPTENIRYQAVWKRFLAYRHQDAGRKMLSVYRDMQPEELPLELQPLQSLECGGMNFQDTVLKEINRMFGRQDRTAGLTREILDTLRKGEELLNRGEYEKAAENFRRVRELDAEESEAHWGLILAATENLKKPVISESVDTDYQRAMQFAPPAKKTNWQQAMSDLMTEPVWQALCECTDYFNKTNADGTPEVIDAIERVYLYMPKGDKRLKEIDTYHKKTDMNQELWKLQNDYQKRDAAVQPLFAEQTKAENEFNATNDSVSPILNLSTLMTVLTAASMFLLLAVQILLVWNFRYTTKYAGTTFNIVRILFYAGVICLLPWLITLLSGYGWIASAVVLFVVHYFFIRHIRQTILFLIPVPMVILLVFRIAVLVASGTVARTVNRRNAAAEKVKRVDDEINEAYRTQVAGIYRKYGMEPQEPPVYKLSHSKGFSMIEWGAKPVKTVPYILSTVLIFAAVVGGATVISNGFYASEWKNIESMAPSDYHVVALKKDGTVVSNGMNDMGQCDVSGWQNIVQVTAGNKFSAGLKEDGTVVVAGGYDDWFSSVTDWTDIVSISASDDHLVGLKKDGTCVAAGSNDNSECEVSDFEDVVKVCAVSSSTGGLTFVLTESGEIQCTDNSEWSSIKAWCAEHTGSGEGQYKFTSLYGRYGALIATTDDGKIKGLGSDYYHQLSQTEDWDASDIIDVWVCNSTVALRQDGTVRYAGNNTNIESKVSEWENITAISGCSGHVLGLKEDGTVVAAGDNHVNQLETDDWKDIEKIYTGYLTSYGVRSDGSVAFAGYGYGGMSYVSSKSPVGVVKFWISTFHW